MTEKSFKSPRDFTQSIRMLEADSDPEILVVDLADISEEVLERMELYRNKFYEINLIVGQTQFEFFIEGQKYTPRGEPYLCVVAPQQLQSYKVLGTDEAQGYLLYFSPTIYQKLKKLGLPLAHFQRQHESYYPLETKHFAQLLTWPRDILNEQSQPN